MKIIRKVTQETENRHVIDTAKSDRQGQTKHLADEKHGKNGRRGKPIYLEGHLNKSATPKNNLALPFNLNVSILA